MGWGWRRVSRWIDGRGLGMVKAHLTVQVSAQFWGREGWRWSGAADIGSGLEIAELN